MTAVRARITSCPCCLLFRLARRTPTALPPARTLSLHQMYLRIPNGGILSMTLLHAVITSFHSC